MLRIKLAADDRTRYGLPEWIEYDTNRPTLGEIRKLKAQLDWGWQHFTAGLQQSADLDTQLAHLAVLWWLAVNRHTEVTWAEFDVDIFGAEPEGAQDPNSSAPTGA